VVVVAVVTGAAALPHWVPLQTMHWPWILTLGMTGTVGQLLIIEAFRKAPVSMITPFEYTALIWALSLDWLLWSTAPNLRTLIGGAIVAASGLYVIYREYLRTTSGAGHTCG